MTDPIFMGTVFTGYEDLTADLEPASLPFARRTWRERLFSWPWRPWEAYRPVTVTMSGYEALNWSIYEMPK